MPSIKISSDGDPDELIRRAAEILSRAKKRTDAAEGLAKLEAARLHLQELEMEQDLRDDG